MASTKAGTARSRGRLGFAALAAVAAPLLLACGPMPGEEPTAQFPSNQPIGAEGFPSSDQGTFADVNGIPYGNRNGGGQPSSYAVATAEGAGGGGGLGPSDPNAPIGDQYADTDPSALTDFHAALDPYGAWVDDATYGTMWQPSNEAVGNDFAPYETAGHWSYGDDYVWVSDYSWGWAPFHYGRWVYATNGWGWIPGRQYAGAWTSWRTVASAGYVGWAPLPPTWYWRGGYAVGLGVVPPAPYGFCRTGDLFAGSLGGRMATGPQVATLGQASRSVAAPGAVASRGYGVPYGGQAGSSYGSGRTLAHPEVAGPSPQSMHISQNAVTRPPPNNAGLARAAQFAHPSTATALGAHAPAGAVASNGRSNAYGTSGEGRYGGAAARPSNGTYAYGSYGSRGGTRTIGGAGAGNDGAIERPRYYGRPSTTLGHGGGGGVGYGRPSGFGSHAFTYGGGHGGVVAAPSTSQPPVYGGGYHPSGSSGGGGHFGGHGGGGGGHGGGHR